jgi:hypothetical protein
MMTKVKINKHEKSDAEDDENDSHDGEDDDDEGDDNQQSQLGGGDQVENNRGSIEYKLSGKNFDSNFANDPINSSNSQYFYNNAYTNNSSDQQTFNRLPTLMINGDSAHAQQTQHIYTWMKDNRQASGNTNMMYTQQQNATNANNLTSPCKLNQNGSVNFYFDKSSPVNINETQLSSSDSGSSPTISSTNNNNNNSSCLSVNQSDSLVSITGKTS